MVGDIDVTLANQPESSSSPFRAIDIFISECPEKKSANTFVTLLWKRYGLHILGYSIGGNMLLNELNKKSLSDSKLASHLINGVQTGAILNDRDLSNATENLQPKICLKSSELITGRKWLESLGIYPNAKIALLLGRDESYGSWRRDNPEYHLHRNSDINQFELASKDLVDRGYFVFRMGSLVTSKFLCADEERIFDYATNGMRTEFRDVFLANVCTIMISVSSGYDALPTAFRKPIVYVNYPCIGTAPVWKSNSILLCKLVKDTFTHQNLTIDDLHQRGVLFSFDKGEFDKANCYFVDNTQIEIQETVTEALDHLLSKKQYSETDNNLQSLFNAKLESYYAQAPCNIKCLINTRYSSFGLRSGQFNLAQTTW